MELMDHQLEVIDKLSSGKILYGNVGSGKSAAILAYYIKKEVPRDIYVITTAKKRDSLDWEKEASKFGISTDVFLENEEYRKYRGILTVDSWNKLKEYTDIEDAFFIFDEQRLVGYGPWVKNFLKVAKKNHWVLLTATPGDTWMDYAPVFIANGFYRNITHFKFDHVLYEPFIKYPKIRGWLNERKLEILRNDILVEMPFINHTERYMNWTDVSYNLELFRRVYHDRWNIYENRPIKDAAELFRCMRKVVNTDPSRLERIIWLMNIHPRLIIFYNFDYELGILRTLSDQIDVFEYNGHIKNPLPDGDNWIYLVQYVAGAEAWNCTTTDAMVLYSLTYSYKNFEQALGRIDRLDTKYVSLYYYILVSNSLIDRAVRKALGSKKSFNERRFLKEFERSFGTSEEFVEKCEI